MKAMTKKRWIAVLTALAVVVAASVTTAFVLGGDSEPKENPLLAPAPTEPPTTKKVTTTTAEEPLPQPEPPPKDPYAPTPLVQVGVIEIPKIGVVHKVYGAGISSVRRLPAMLIAANVEARLGGGVQRGLLGAKAWALVCSDR